MYKGEVMNSNTRDALIIFLEELQKETDYISPVYDKITILIERLLEDETII
jgi:hypothetical protein